MSTKTTATSAISFALGILPQLGSFHAGEEVKEQAKRSMEVCERAGEVASGFNFYHANAYAMAGGEARGMFDDGPFFSPTDGDPQHRAFYEGYNTITDALNSLRTSCQDTRPEDAITNVVSLPGDYHSTSIHLAQAVARLTDWAGGLGTLSAQLGIEPWIGAAMVVGVPLTLGAWHLARRRQPSMKESALDDFNRVAPKKIDYMVCGNDRAVLKDISEAILKVGRAVHAESIEWKTEDLRRDLTNPANMYGELKKFERQLHISGETGWVIPCNKGDFDAALSELDRMRRDGRGRRTCTILRTENLGSDEVPAVLTWSEDDRSLIAIWGDGKGGLGRIVRYEPSGKDQRLDRLG